MRRCLIAAVVAVATLAGCSATRGGAASALPSGGPGSARPAAGGTAAAASPSPAPAVSPGTTAGATPAGAGHGHYVFPVAGTTSYSHTHHDYPASDIMAACGSPVRAVVDGVLLEVNRVDRYDPRTNDGGTRGGLFVSVLGADGVRYYGSHLRALTPGLGPGDRVLAGEQLGEVGHSGDASACHLHFGISPPCLRVGDWWVRRGVVWPWSYLDSWRRGGASSPVGVVTAWQGSHGCPTSAGVAG